MTSQKTNKTKKVMYIRMSCTLYLKINFKPVEYFSTHSLSQLACNEGVFWGHASAKTAVNHPLGYHFYSPQSSSAFKIQQWWLQGSLVYKIRLHCRLSHNN